MGSKPNDFHSLLSVFRDATAPKNSSANQASGQKASASRYSSTDVTKSDHDEKCSAGDDNSRTERSVDPTSTTDPSYSASLMKEHIDRLIRIHQIQKSTASASKYERTPIDGDTQQDVHIAVCATIVQDFPHEQLWRKWIEETGGDLEILVGAVKSGSNTNEGQVSAAEKPDEDPISGKSSIQINASAEMYVHAKNPERIRSEWLRSKTLAVTHRPNWNDVRIIRAMLSLLEVALRDERTTHILFCTESCIPVVTMKEAARSILLDEPCVCEETSSENPEERVANGSINWDRSYIDCYDKNSHRCSRFDEHNCWGYLRDSIPVEAIFKALPGWCLLSRKHAQHIIDLPSRLGGMNLWPAFEKVWAPEEVYFPTALNICGLMDEVVRRSVTHSKWNEKASNLKDRAHPICYDGYFDDDLVHQVSSEGCLFLRKMKQSIDMEVWHGIVVDRRKMPDEKLTESSGRSKRERDWNERWERADRGLDRDLRSDRGSAYRSRRDDYNHRRSYESIRHHEDVPCRKRRR
ncbi:hypothetical protein HJC23_010009 [Cyclotella cryptica]|uniref:Uncharacterized protein n=1 Tax=Cyclotella cryptica TaxID=29204 RepID=A0ABD3Q9Y5_9STRA|eukprot:CCRYP_007793-RA/>CCRYP_007793-RA protein AED:0.04 eAED:0.04 QI:101/1/1/1/1/1/4/271/521